MIYPSFSGVNYLDQRFKEHFVITSEQSFDKPEDLKRNLDKLRSEIVRDHRERNVNINDFLNKIAFPIKKVGDLGEIVSGKKLGQIYSRSGNEAEMMLRKVLVELELGYMRDIIGSPHNYFDAAVFPSGMSAVHNTVMELIRHVPIEPVNERKKIKFIQGNNIYVHSNSVLNERLVEMGLNPAMRMDTTNLETVEQILEMDGGKVAGIFFEPITNPLMQYTDTRGMSEIAKKHNTLVIVDNTFLTPWGNQPFREGADLVIHSLTKYINGEGDLTGGVVIGPKVFINSLRAYQIQTGAVFSAPELPYRIFERACQLPERMEKHLGNAKEISDFLRANDDYVAKVNYPKIANARHRQAGAVISFVMQGKTSQEKQDNERKLMEYVIRNKGPVVHQVSLGENEHLIFGETTYGLPPERGHEVGLVRFAIGRSDVKEAIQYLNKAFQQVYQK